MRLLNIYDLTFREFHSDDLPKYAVASHRWAEGAEATLKDVEKRRNTKKSGYVKVEGFADYVKKNLADINWVWIDTCCIDQKSSREVSEAVNSMFRWYHNAEVCLAYLVDVTRADDVDSLMQSSWFRRVWTLQELLAPHTVIFLTQEWQPIGHKGRGGRTKSGTLLSDGPSLDTAIAAITGIPEIVLQDYSQCQSLTNDEKLLWMRGRETTKAEDMWYCLFGIFDVAIGTNYGEGGENAQSRLLAEVRRRARKRPPSDTFDDCEGRGLNNVDRNNILKELAIADGAEFGSYLDRHEDECLPGTRTELLRQIKEWIMSPQGKCMFWLNGVAGTGKSTIARTVAKSCKIEQQLGASFFFKRGEGDRGSAAKVFPTLANQLARSIPQLFPYVRNAIIDEPNIGRKSLQEQFDNLLLQPLLKLTQTDSQRSDEQRTGNQISKIVVVIDALDECEDEMDVRLILKLFPQLQKRLRIFLTSRPELPIRLGLQELANDEHQDFILHRIPRPVIEHDISLFLKHRLSRIQKERGLPLDLAWVCQYTGPS